MIHRIIIPILIAIILPEIYLDVHYLRHRFHYGWQKRLLWLFPGIFMVIYSLALATIRNFAPSVLRWLNFYLILVGLFTVPKALFALCSFCGLLVKKLVKSRHNWGNVVGMVVGLTCVYIFFYGYTIGFYQLRVRHVDLYFDDLPSSFDGYRVLQFSDLHVGSYRGWRRQILERAVDSIRSQRADLIVFTGDLQNMKPDEIDPYHNLLASIHAKDGVYSVLGNHDYSMYVKYEPERERALERQTILQEQHLGWQLLRNEHVTLHRGADSIFLAGEENYGFPPFPQRGDISKTLKGIPPHAFTILLQHDPAAWRAQILPQSDCQLTLSGHTHGGQIALFGWRPIQLRVPENMGLYEEGQRKLYVSAGIGGLVPFRFGVPGEINLLTLHTSR